MGLLDNLNNFLLVSLGAVFGANARFIIYKSIEKRNINKNFIILFINSLSSFLLGLFFSILSQIPTLNYSSQLVIFFSIGLLGSLSSFSTFIYDLYELLIQLKYYTAFKLLIISLIAGILSFTFGFLLSI